MTRTVLTKLRRFAEQTQHGTKIYEGNNEHALVQVGEIATLLEWLEKNRYNMKIFREGQDLIQSVVRYRSMEGRQSEIEIGKESSGLWPGRRK